MNKVRIFRFCKVMTTRLVPETNSYSIKEERLKNTHEYAESHFR